MKLRLQNALLETTTSLARSDRLALKSGLITKEVLREFHMDRQQALGAEVEGSQAIISSAMRKASQVHCFLKTSTSIQQIISPHHKSIILLFHHRCYTALGRRLEVAQVREAEREFLKVSLGGNQ